MRCARCPDWIAKTPSARRDGLRAAQILAFRKGNKVSELSELFTPPWWQAKTLFTDEQLHKILKPLQFSNRTKFSNGTIARVLQRIARRHGELRSQPTFSRSATRKKLERICRLSAQLREEI